ncbi:hypothetical protein BJ684DRAFT_21159 [Piptocephalis cylindrospora]|uniref:Uncharacterized protein n=1 Tax=Piptocephalis cylindrospora TaxID=1907219 RepID=A0A4P9Y1A5_9FUNG|nr:hypothetical protein BJ684DRAFT_21159 [Piptocephalis cylindrospora]|eukprot:RKP12292.1 hypothetical protein BJ684DRAFT_21159 [Piptocephalis cylindrospora]
MPKVVTDMTTQCEAFRKGASYFRRGNFREAVVQFTLALSLQSNRLDILDGRATALHRLGKEEAARADARQMILCDPGDPRGYLRLGRLFAMSGRIGEARQTYERGLGAARAAHPLQSVRRH